MDKAGISLVLRNLKLSYWVDGMRFLIKKLQNNSRNQAFVRNNPTVVLPPDYMMYESFGLDYGKYYTDSIETAEWLAGLFRKHMSLYNLNILDWGCGPARIIRHLPKIIGNGCLYFGTDYNHRTIAWNEANIQGVTFSRNQLQPPLEYDNNFHHIIYGISIFTHLSEPMHQAWMNELKRVLSPGGILVVTTQGSAFRVKLTPEERRNFDKGKLVVRGKVKEGHRTYSAFQPISYMEQLFEGMDILEFIERQSGNGRPQQDVWIVRKKPAIP